MALGDQLYSLLSIFVFWRSESCVEVSFDEGQDGSLLSFCTGVGDLFRSQGSEPQQCPYPIVSEFDRSVFCG